VKINELFNEAERLNDELSIYDGIGTLIEEFRRELDEKARQLGVQL
jgi:hypothetical protein